MVFARVETFDKSEIAPNLVGISCWFDSAIQDVFGVEKNIPMLGGMTMKKNPALW